MINTRELNLNGVRTHRDENNSIWYCLKDLYNTVGLKNTETKPNNTRKFTVYYDGGRKGKQDVRFVDERTADSILHDTHKADDDTHNDNIKTFNGDYGQMRATADDDGNLWFCAWDVCGILRYASGYDATMRYVDGTDMTKMQTPMPQGTQSLTYVNESGLNSLIMASKASYKGRFRKWLTGTVIPSLTADIGTMGNIVNNPDLIIRLATALKEERQRRIDLENSISRQRDAWQDRVEKECDYLELIRHSPDSMAITRIAADYAMTARKLNSILERLGVQWKVQGQWVLTMRHADNGYTSSRTIRIPVGDGKERLKTVTEWTQKGRMFIYDLLKQNGILPERERRNGDDSVLK